MEDIKKTSEKYLDLLTERSKKSKVYKQYQSIGLTLAEILEDSAHKALYIRLAKTHDGHMLIDIARKVAEKKHISKKGAYFMMVLKNRKNGNINHK